MKKSRMDILKNWKIPFLIMVMLLSLYHSKERKYDGNTFIETGKRMISGETSSIYQPIKNSAPFVYMPQISPSFSLLLLFGERFAYRILIFANGMALFLSLIVLEKFLKKRNIHSWYFLLIPALSFWFIINESLYIGQIDLILMFLILLFIYSGLYSKHILAGILFGFLIQWKPFILILGVSYILFFYFQKNTKAIIRFTVSSVSCFFMIIGLFMIFFKLDMTEYLNLFKSFYKMAEQISFGYCCNAISISLKSFLYNMFTLNLQDGRWYPIKYADIHEIHNFKLFYLNERFIESIYNVIRIAFFILYLSFLRKTKDILKVMFASLAVIPTFSIVFWFAHLVYFLPSVVYAANLILYEKSQYISRLFLSIFLALIFLISPYTTGGYSTDLFTIYGLYYFFSVFIFLILIQNHLPEKQKTQKDTH